MLSKFGSYEAFGSAGVRGVRGLEIQTSEWTLRPSESGVPDMSMGL